jgi:hypothetical protein
VRIKKNMFSKSIIKIKVKILIFDGPDAKRQGLVAGCWLLEAVKFGVDGVGKMVEGIRCVGPYPAFSDNML